MTNRQFINHLAKNSGMTTLEANAVLQHFIAIIQQSAADGKPICIQNFGTFDIKHKKEKQLFNINSGQMHEVPATDTITFRQSVALRSKLSDATEKEDEA